MSVVPGGLETDSQPPMTIPLRHFVVGIGFLVAGALAGVASVLDVGDGFVALAHVHLLVVGWVCVTIMGAMTQFVPVWSGVTLHSRRLATVQLWLVAVGLVGFAGSLLVRALPVAPGFGALMAVGFWTFAYNVGRTLSTVDALDVTERHFVLALAFFLALTALGLLLAVDFVVPVFGSLPVTRADVVAAHATFAVFGAILTTVLGALYQLATMFTQTECHGVDLPLRRFEEVAYPVGVVALATGRLVDQPILATAGGLLVAGGIAAMGVVLARRLYEAQVPWTPMHSRYAVVAPAMVVWAALAAVAWIDSPLSSAARFGAPGSTHLLAVGVVGFVVLGTLYHVVPFVVWVHRYSERLGYESVPMIDDLYDDRLAAADFALVLAGGALFVAAEWFALGDSVTIVGGASVVAGVAVFGANLLGVIHRHSPYGVLPILAPGFRRDSATDGSADDVSMDP